MGIGTAILNHEMLMDSQKMDIDDFNVFAEFNEFNEFKESIDFDDYNDRIRGNSNAKQIKVFPPPKPKKKGKHEKQKSNLELFRESLPDDVNLSDVEHDGFALAMREEIDTDDERRSIKRGQSSSISGVSPRRQRTNDTFSMRSPVEDSINDEFGMFDPSRTRSSQYSMKRKSTSRSAKYGASALRNFQKNSVVGMNGPHGTRTTISGSENAHHPVVPSPEMKGHS